VLFVVCTQRGAEAVYNNEASASRHCSWLNSGEDVQLPMATVIALDIRDDFDPGGAPLASKETSAQDPSPVEKTPDSDALHNVNL